MLNNAAEFKVQTMVLKIVEAGVLPVLVKAMKGLDEKEQESAAKIAWTLSFGEHTKDKV